MAFTMTGIPGQSGFPSRDADVDADVGVVVDNVVDVLRRSTACALVSNVRALPFTAPGGSPESRLIEVNPKTCVEVSILQKFISGVERTLI